MLDAVEAVVSLFAFHPLRCAFVAAAFTVALGVHRGPLVARAVVGVTALAWWGFAVLEWVTPTKASIRLDLVILGPLFLALALVGTLCIATNYYVRGTPKLAGERDA